MEKFWENCYIRFSSDDIECKIKERKWIIGTILLLAFSPGFYLLIFNPSAIRTSLCIAWLVMGLILLAGVTCIGFYRKSHFHKGAGLFEYERGFFAPLRNIQGSLREIQTVELQTTVDQSNKGGRFIHTNLLLYYRDQKITLYESSTNLNEARRLAALVGCGLKLVGQNDVWGISSGRTYEEDAETVYKNSNDDRKDLSVKKRAKS